MIMRGTLRGSSTPNDIHHFPRLSRPASSRNTQAPLPFEIPDHDPVDEPEKSQWINAENDDQMQLAIPNAAFLQHSSANREQNRKGRSELKKPHLAISELVDSTIDDGYSSSAQIQLPSFVSLSVVEKSPTQAQLSFRYDRIHDYPHKRPRLDTLIDQSDTAHDMNRLLPRPVQKDDKQVIPLLPAMVTGLHEPPPSSGVLPSMDLDARPTLQRSTTTTTKMLVKDMLSIERAPNNRPPEQMLNTPKVTPAELPKPVEVESQSPDVDTPPGCTTSPATTNALRKDVKTRRARRKWSQAESQDLLAGVKKHGVGRWKQILVDPSFTFVDRTSIDLKDRYRVYAKDIQDSPADAATSDDAPPDDADASPDGHNSRSQDLNNSSSRRRKRHPWSREEDNTLLLGVQKYGFQWTDIHNDGGLGLTHRRATDLRDRIRNLYPDGYKHAEARPLRAEIKKAEKAGKKETPAGILYAPPSQLDSINFSTTRSSPTNTKSFHTERRQTMSGRVASIASLTQPENGDNTIVNDRPGLRRSRTVIEMSEHNGITLPSLALDSTSDADDWDNTLPPFMGWEQELQ